MNISTYIVHKRFSNISLGDFESYTKALKYAKRLSRKLNQSLTLVNHITRDITLVEKGY